jgi:hypothetical protein
MTRAEQIKLIHGAFTALARAQIPASWGFADEKLFGMNLKTEREYRRGRTGMKLSVKDAARLFTVKHLAEALENPDRYTVADIISIRSECLYAQAYVAQSGPAIRAAFEGAGISIADLLVLDYSALV